MPARPNKRLVSKMPVQLRKKLQVAASTRGLTLSQFAHQTTLRARNHGKANESTIVLTRRESLRLLALIKNPPPRNEKFIQAQARYLRLRSLAVLPSE